MMVIILLASFIAVYWINDQSLVMFDCLLEKDYISLIQRKSWCYSQSLYIRLAVVCGAMIIAEWIDLSLFNTIVAGLIAYKVFYYYLQFNKARQNKVVNQLFPYYLNQLTMLVQDLPVVNAIQKSIEYAPDFFKQDLSCLIRRLHDEAESIEPYLDFARKYPEIDDLPRIMRALYHLSKNASHKEVMLTSLTMMTHEKVAVQMKQDLERHLDLQQLVPYVLFLWLGVYIVALFSFVKVG